MNLYLTADNVGEVSGGGSVTAHEVQALKELGTVEVWDRKQINSLLGPPMQEPWGWDERFTFRFMASKALKYKLACGYAGTFTDSIKALRNMGTKVCWTVAAHDLEESIKEHVSFYGYYPFPHMSDPALFDRYKQGYLDADVVVCPSNYSANIMRKYGRTGRIEVIPHGCEIPKEAKPLPTTFAVGYLGAYGPDKGVKYLLQTWKKLAYKDAVLILAGRETAKPEVQDWCRIHGGGNVRFMGWMDDVADFYNQISLYVQPSVSEGFGIEVLEAMAHGRPVICSAGAGANELVPLWYKFSTRNVGELADKIEQVKIRGGCVGLDQGYPDWQETAKFYSWDKIRERYKTLWREMLND